MLEEKMKEYTFYAYDKTKYVIQLIDGKAIIDPPCGAMFALETNVTEIIAAPSVQDHNANISPKDFGNYLEFLEHGDGSSINVNIKIYEGTFSLTIFPNGLFFPSRREL
ncbi:TPA: hypothetical protein DCP88_02320 [Candidatus Campbellbacteria bacterium]|nr:MAG: hypothetical protein UR58_C0001G0628 [Candidatus Campbellbacteria bacterium GW2011_OD1_34_28]HAP74135.1 hypothetical protein [Candidatus Campbellbacteria bacterium]HAQ01642.1 hypothetical protein [Candidatus Campbellbacteria bacterium]